MGTNGTRVHTEWAVAASLLTLLTVTGCAGETTAEPAGQAVSEEAAEPVEDSTRVGATDCSEFDFSPIQEVLPELEEPVTEMWLKDGNIMCHLPYAEDFAQQVVAEEGLDPDTIGSSRFGVHFQITPSDGDTTSEPIGGSTTLVSPAGHTVWRLLLQDPMPGNPGYWGVNHGMRNEDWNIGTSVVGFKSHMPSLETVEQAYLETLDNVVKEL